MHPPADIKVAVYWPFLFRHLLNTLPSGLHISPFWLLSRCWFPPTPTILTKKDFCTVKLRVRPWAPTTLQEGYPGRPALTSTLSVPSLSPSLLPLSRCCRVCAKKWRRKGRAVESQIPNHPLAIKGVLELCTRTPDFLPPTHWSVTSALWICPPEKQLFPGKVGWLSGTSWPVSFCMGNMDQSELNQLPRTFCLDYC